VGALEVPLPNESVDVEEVDGFEELLATENPDVVLPEVEDGVESLVDDTVVVEVP